MIILKETKVREVFGPTLIALGRSDDEHGNVMFEVVDAPEKYPIMRLIGYVEILSVSHEH